MCIIRTPHAHGTHARHAHTAFGCATHTHGSEYLLSLHAWPGFFTAQALSAALPPFLASAEYRLLLANLGAKSASVVAASASV